MQSKGRTFIRHTTDWPCTQMRPTESLPIICPECGGIFLTRAEWEQHHAPPSRWSRFWAGIRRARGLPEPMCEGGTP